MKALIYFPPRWLRLAGCMAASEDPRQVGPDGSCEQGTDVFLFLSFSLSLTRPITQMQITTLLDTVLKSLTTTGIDRN